MPTLTRLDRWVIHYARWVIARRWWVLALALALSLGAGWGVTFLTIHDDYRAYFDKDNPDLKQLIALQNTYTRSNNVLFVLAPADGVVFERDTLAAITDLTERAWRLPFASRVDSVTNYQHTEAIGDDLEVADLVEDATTLSEADLERKRDIALGEPWLVNRMISRDASVTAVNVTFHFPELDHQENALVTDAARELAAEFEAAHPGIKLYLTGLVLLDAAFVEASVHDIVTLVPIMYALIIIVMLLLLRSFFGMVVTIALVALSVLAGEGLAGWLGFQLTPPSAGSASMIMTLAVADSVHILVTLFAGMRRGLSKADALVESLRVNTQPVFLTSITTAVGFLIMNFGDSPPFRDLGNITAMGVMCAFLLAMTVVPALIMLLPLKAPAGRDLLAPYTRRIGEFVIANRGPVLVVVLTAALGALAMIPRNELDDQFLKYFDEGVAFRTHTEFAVDNLTGIYQIHYSLPAGEENGVSEPAFLRSADDYANWLRTQPEVLHVSSITDTFKRLNKDLHGADPAWYRLPDSRPLAAQYLLLYEMSLPFGLDLNNQLDIGKSKTQVVATLRNVSSNEVRDLARRGEDWLRANAPDLTAPGVGGSVVFAEVSRRTIRNMLFGTLFGLVVISALLILVLRNLRLGLISIAPNLLPAGISLGLWGLIVGEVNMAVSVVVAMTLGIVVDDTVHFLSKYQRARRERGLNVEEAIRYAFATVASALVTTSAVLAAGFSVLMWSTFKVNSTAATLIVVTLIFALVIDFLLLPALLLYLDRRSTPVARDPQTNLPPLATGDAQHTLGGM